MSVSKPISTATMRVETILPLPAGFLICAADTPALTVLYADADARRWLRGTNVVGSPLAALFAGSDVEGRFAAAHGKLGAGGAALDDAELSCRCHRRCRVAVRLQAVPAGGDGRRRALCILNPRPPRDEPAATIGEIIMDRTMPVAAAPATETLDDVNGAAEPLDLADFTETLADRLAWLLPGAVHVELTPALLPSTATVPADPLEEIAAALLMEASPPERWRYTVRVAVGSDGDGLPTLRLTVPGGSLACRRPVAELQVRMDGLGIAWRRLDDDTIDLILPPAAAAIDAAARRDEDRQPPRLTATAA